MRRITIVGGGLAGLTLGIILREKGVPVRLWDALGYPRHRVCGEFISGAGAELLSPFVNGLAARAAEDTRFYTEFGSTDVIRLPQPGLSIPRWALDEHLARRFEEAGGDLVARQRWTGAFDDPGVVRATGRKLVPQQPGWVGLKAHAFGLPLTADLELHFSALGYIGLLRLPDRVNLCALVHSSCDISNFRAEPRSVFRQLLSPGSVARLDSVTIDPASVCAVSGISFQTRAAPNECSIGDAIQMIPPFTGNGMSLAVESAFLAAPSIIAFAHNQIDWAETIRQIRFRCGKQFRARFAASSVLRCLAVRGWTRALLLSTLRTVPRLLPIFFRCTR